jgi:hypothetical protein
MQQFLLDFHSIFRWVVLLVAVGALALAVMSATGSRPWDGLSDRVALAFTVAMDVQLLIGLTLWVAEQRWSISDTFLTWLHPLLMIAAVGLAHVGRARADRAEGDKARGTAAALFFGGSLLVVLIAIPLYAWPL